MTVAIPALTADAVDTPTATLTDEEQQFLRRLFNIGFALRAGLALLLEWAGYSQRMAPDEMTYHEAGWNLSLYWSGDLFVLPQRFERDAPLGYFYVNAALFYVFGNTAIPIKLVNAAIGALCAKYVYLISRDLFGVPIARRSATLAQYFPSLVLWSALNIRDVWVILFIVYISWLSIRLLGEFSLSALLKLVTMLFLLTKFRDYLFLVVALPPLVAFLIGRRGHLGRNFVLALLAGSAVILLAEQGAGKRTRSLTLETLSQTRQDMATGGSAFAEGTDISTPTAAIGFLPVALLYFFFSPFPWQITSILKLLSLPEMLLVYALTPATLRGLWYAVTVKLRPCVHLLLLTGLLTVAYALAEGNVGTLYRHRAQVLPLYLMFSAVGLHMRAMRRRAIAPQ